MPDDILNAALFPQTLENQCGSNGEAVGFYITFWKKTLVTAYKLKSDFNRTDRSGETAHILHCFFN